MLGELSWLSGVVVAPVRGSYSWSRTEGNVTALVFWPPRACLSGIEETLPRNGGNCVF